jgi:hypothetical protein
VLAFFKDEIANLFVPGKDRCEQFRAENSCPHPWRIIKNCVHSAVCKIKKQRRN